MQRMNQQTTGDWIMDKLTANEQIQDERGFLIGCS